MADAMIEAEKDTNILTPEAEALRAAYRKSYEFEPIAAVFSPSPETILFIKSAAPQKVECYNDIKKKNIFVRPSIEASWNGLKRIGFDRIDAAFAGTSLPSRSSAKLEGYDLKLYPDREAYAKEYRKVYAKEYKESPASFKITEQSLERLRSGGVPQDVLEKLKGVRNRKVTGEKPFLKLLEETLEKRTTKYKSLFLNHAEDPNLKQSVIIVKVDDRLDFQITNPDAELAVVESEASLSSRHAEEPAKREHDERLADLKTKLEPYWGEEVPNETKAEIIDDVRTLLNPRFDLDGKVCFFRQDQYIWMDYNSEWITPDIVPTPIREGWPGVTFDSIDAALNAGSESIYFFRDNEYIRFNWTKNEADFKPKKIREHWAGVTFDRIDAAIYWENGKVYFFRGDRYIVYDMVTCAGHVHALGG